MGKIISLLFLVTLLVSCADTSKPMVKKTKGESKETHDGSSLETSYYFKGLYNDCNTGDHHFSEQSKYELKEKICETLQDNERNNNCAVELREIKFNHQCTGTWSPF